MKATYRKLQIVSQDRMSVLEYGGIKVKQERNSGYVIYVIGHGALYPAGKYYSEEKVHSVVQEILHHANNGKSHYYMPVD